MVGKGSYSCECEYWRDLVRLYRVWEYLCSRGSGTATFWTYNISSNFWSAKANAPGNVGAGGTWLLSDLAISLRSEGAASREFWVYNISRNNWSRMANTPGNVGAGGGSGF